MYEFFWAEELVTLDSVYCNMTQIDHKYIKWCWFNFFSPVFFFSFFAFYFLVLFIYFLILSFSPNFFFLHFAFCFLLFPFLLFPFPFFLNILLSISFSFLSSSFFILCNSILILLPFLYLFFTGFSYFMNLYYLPHLF